MNKLQERVENEIKKIEKTEYPVIVEMTNCIYEFVESCAKELGWKVRRNEKKTDFTIFWIDASPSFKRITKMKNYQKINHFAGTNCICKKHQLIYHIEAMKRKYKNKEFHNVIPESFVFPIDFLRFQQEVKLNQFYIVKPHNEAQGRNIKILKFSNKEDVNKNIEPFKNNFIIQEYIEPPFLLDGKKFDLRIYVLIKSLNPLKVFVFNEGLVRICSNKYQPCSNENKDKNEIHLSNFSINKKFCKDVTEIKKSFKYLNKKLIDSGYNDKEIWNDIFDIIIKTILSARKELIQNYEKLLFIGFDVLLFKNDKNEIKPSLLEVNVSPSFHGGSELDDSVKYGVLKETMELIGINPDDKKQYLIEEKKKFLNRLLKKKIKNNDDKKEKEKEKEEEELLVDYHDEIEKKYLKNFIKVYPTKESEEKFSKYL